ncbi:MAG: hypothetical protein IJB83_04685 [Bacilli bacterium]|nr:hypothetical protein [Bacilli bacterium]
MKEATGELNMTVVTLVAVAAVGALFYFVIWPVIQRMVMNQTCSTYGGEFTAVEAEGSECSGLDNDKVTCWKCCPDGDKSSPRCIVATENSEE